MADNEVRMMMSVVPGAMTGFAALNAGLVSINNVFGAMTRSIDAQFGLINTAIMTTGVVVAQLGANAMDAFGQFEQGMKIVQMVSGQTSSDIDLLKNKANEFSIQYRMDIDQLTEGLQTLGRAGLNSASEQAEVLENGLYTAKLEGRDLKGVLEELIQTTALLGGDLKSSDFGEQSGYVENLMVATSMTAPITTHDVNETLKYSGGIAAAAGANIDSEEGKRILEDYMGSIAAFAQKGVTGSIAGTALRAFFNKPATQDSSVKEALSSINLTPESLWEDDEQTMKPVSEQIGLIQDQMDKLHISTMDRLQIWSKIVGGKMGQQMMKLNSDDIKELTADIRSADNASSLAANSMKTYEANLKAIGETGASLERNVGQRLVFFANPIIEVLNKVASFLNNDVTASILAISIISFITIAGKKAIDVVRAVRAEISTLYAGMKAQQQFFTQKQGVVRVGDNSLERESIDKYKAYFKAKDEYYGTSRDGKSSSGEKVSTPTNLKDFSKQFSSTFKQSGALTLKSFQEAGISAEKTALAGHLMGLTSAKNSLGLPEGQIWAAALKNNLISPEQFNKMFTAYGAGVNARPTADLVKIESIIPQIKACEQALKDLGVTATQAVQPPITAEEERAAAEAFAAEAINTTKQEITEEEVFRNTLNNKIYETRDAITQEIYEEGLFEQAIRKESQAAVDAAIKTDVMAERVILDFNRMSAAISVSASNLVNIPNRMHPKTSIYGKLYEMPGYFDSSRFFGDPYHGMPKLYTGHYDSLSPLYKEWMKSGLGRAFGYNLSDDKMAHYLAANRIPGYLNMSEKAQEIHRNNIKTYPDIGRNSVMPIYGPASPEGIKRWEQVQENVKKGLGGGVGNIPSTQEKLRTHEDQRREYEDKKVRLAKQARNEYSEKDTASTKALQQHQENIKRQNLSQVQYLEEGLILEEERLSVIKQELLIEQEKLNIAGNKERYAKELNEKRTNLVNKLNEQTQKENESRDKQFKRHTQQVKNQTPQSYSSMATLNTKAFNNAVEEAEKASKQYENSLRAVKKIPITGNALIAQQGLSNSVNTAIAKYGMSSPYGAGSIYTSKGSGEDWKTYNETKNLLARMPSTGRGGLVGDPEYVAKQSGRGFGSAFAKNFSDRLNRDRTGSFFSFGSTTVNGVTRSATKGLSGLANKALNATDMIGGPFMVAMMAATTAIQMWQKAFQEYCEDLKEAGDKLSDAYSKWNAAEEDLEKSYRKKYPDATDEEIDQMIYDAYSTMTEDMANAINNGNEEWLKKISQPAQKQTQYEYDEEKDDGTMKIKEEEIDDAVALDEAIKENTGALYVATGELNAAMTQYVRKGNDSWWGVDGWTGDVTNFLGGASDSFWSSLNESGFLLDTAWGHGGGSRFSDNGQFLLTSSQQDENYAGYTEMAGLMLEDFKDAKGDWQKGLQIMMGDDAKVLSNVISEQGKQTLQNIAGIDEKGKRIPGSLSTLTPEKNLMLQQSMKNDKKTWKALAKEIAKRDINKKAGRDVTKNLNRITGLVNKLNASMGSNFTETQILQAAYLQQMQDMYQVAQDVIVPIINTNMQTAANILTQTYGVGDNSGNISGSSAGTEGITSVIAGLVAQIALANAADATQNAILMQDPRQFKTVGEKEAYKMAQEASSGKEFMQQAAQASYTKGYTSINWGELWSQLSSPGSSGKTFDFSNSIYGVGPHASTKAMDDILTTFGSGLRMSTYGEDSKTAWDKVDKAIRDWREGGSNSQQIYESLSHITQDPKFLSQLENAYLNSGEDEGTGSGSGSGSGSGDNDDNKGTKKERVDLVLCSKKEIPKLNVNLFKKPPTFTVLNKNFKVRDVKINTEDTPKAIMSSIKNAFIDVQKRSDPKIIQDEDAVYDPEGATDGNPLPSGTAKTRTSE